MASNLTSDLHPALNAAYQAAKAKWIEAHPEGPTVVLTCTYRSNEEQAKLYAQGRTANGPKVTNALPGHSAHNFYPARAFDIGFIRGKKMDWTNELFNEFATILLAQSKNVTWGGHFKSIMDRPHFEITGWKSL